MEVKNAEMQQVMERLARVEKKNRWLVRGGLAVMLLCGSAFLVAQKPVAQTIEAQAFVLKDTAGQVRAELHMTGQDPELRLYDSQHNTSVLLSSAKDRPLLALDGNNGDTVVISIPEKVGGPELFLQKAKAHAHLAVSDDGPFLELTSSGDSANLLVYKDGPTLLLEDSEGFHTSIGSQAFVNPKTGKKSETSAASIVLLAPSGQRLWSAP